MNARRAEPRLIPFPRRVTGREGEPPFMLPGSIRYHGPEFDTARRLLGVPLQLAGADRAAVRAALDPSASPHAQGYRLKVSEEAITLAAPTSEGLRHALATLAQLLHGVPACAPVAAMEIDDAPSITLRGVMLDVSRDKVPTLASLMDAIDTLERLKINHLQLYTEHTFAYRGHEAVWRDASPITPDEARTLDAYCRARGIDLAPNQNTLGHLHRWLSHPRYADLAEIHGDWVFETDDGRRVPRHGPFSLCPTDPRSIELIRDLLDQILPCFASGLCNIGLDEAYDVGQGRSRDETARRGRGAMFFEHLRRVDAIVRDHGKRTLFWADIALKYPDLLDRLPPGAAALVWGYEPDAPFDRHAEALRARGIPFWTCPGTSSWLSITGRTGVRRANIDAAVRAAARHGAEGVLVTDWGDRGHRQHWPIALHSIAYGANAMWRADEPGSFDPGAAAVHALDAPAELGPWLDELGDVDADLRGGRRNMSALYDELHRPLGATLDPAASGDSVAAWRAAAERLEQLGDRLRAMPPGLPSLVREELEHTLRAARLAAARAIARRDPAGRLDPAAVAAEVRAIAAEHRRLWALRNRPGGLDDSTRHYEEIAGA